MPANVDGMVREGISAYRAGRKDEARALLLRAVEIDQYNEQAWLWLSAVVESVDEQRTCLENVLTINPNNERAKQGLQLLTNKTSPVDSAKSASTLAEDVLASTSFTPTPAAAPEANPFALDEDDELPSSIEWDAPPASPTATSSASSNYRVAEPSAAEYDAWVTNLNLGGSSSEDTLQNNALDAAAQFMSTPFDDDEEDLFSSGPFSAADTSLPLTIDTPPPVSTPSMTSRSTSSPGRTADSLLDEIEDDDLFSGAFDQDDDDEDELSKLDAAEFFQYIPKDIQATRLPGTRERYPALVIIGFLAVLLLNVGAVAMLVMNLTAP